MPTIEKITTRPKVAGIYRYQEFGQAPEPPAAQIVRFNGSKTFERCTSGNWLSPSSTWQAFEPSSLAEWSSFVGHD
jgi:hypothetical protein